MKEKHKAPSFSLAILPVLFLILLLTLNMSVFSEDILSGSTQLMLLLASLVVIGISYIKLNIKWKTLENGIVKHFSESIPAILILLLIGILSGTWMLSGVVPAMIYYGLQFVYAPLFLPTVCLICAIVSLSTGSSWTTVATIGIALLGIGKVLGYSDGMVGGAIISGAYFGDKMSPLSDTTNLASSSTRTPLFTHIRSMMYTSIPSFIIAMMLFLLIGLLSSTETADMSRELEEVIKNTYTITPILFIVPLLTLLLIVRRVPAFITLFISSLTAALFAILFQNDVCQMVVKDVTNSWAVGVIASIKAMYGTVELNTGSELLDKLATTRGMGGMMNTIWLIICAMIFGGCMDAAGMLQSLSRAMIRFMHNAVSCVSSTVATCLLMNLTTADQYISILLPGKMYAGVYAKRGLDSSLLSRTLEDSATVTSVLIPWNTCGMAQASVLNIATLTYLPYCFFNLLSPLCSIVTAAIGWGVKRTNEETATTHEANQ